MVTRLITISSSPTTITIPAESSRDIDYIIDGTHTMGGAISIAVSGQLTNKKFTFYYTAALSSYSIGSNYLQFPSGDKLPAELASKKCIIHCIYNGSAWKCMIIPDFTQTGVITGENILDGDIEAADLAADAVTTNKILNSNVTLAKIANIADQTILGNVSGGSAVVDELTVTEVRTLLDQDVTLTGNVTGTATQTFGTGVTTISTTIASNTVTPGMSTNATNRQLLTKPVSLNTNAMTAGVSYTSLKAPYDCTVEEWACTVDELVEATDDATMTLYNHAGTLMTGSSITVTKNTKPATSAPATSSLFNSSSITANNTISAGEQITIKAAKTTAGGLLTAMVKIKKT